MEYNRNLVFTDLLEREDLRNERALIYRDTAYTFGQLRLAVELCAGDLNARGVRCGSRVALWAFNSDAWVISFLAVVRLGAVAVPANYNLGVKETAQLLKNARVNFLISGDNRCSRKYGDKTEEMCGILRLGTRHFAPEELSYRERVDRGEIPGELPAQNREAGATSVVIYTTGTTATPKMVCLSQRSILCDALSGMERVRRECRGQALVGLPLFHSYGLCTLFSYLSDGFAVVIARELKPENLLELISRYRVSDVCSVGILYLGLEQHPLFAKEAAPWLRTCIVGGGYTDPEQIYRMHCRFPEISFVIGYGLSEASPIVSVAAPLDSVEKRACTVGKPLSCLQVKISTPGGENAGTGRSGEVCVRGDIVMNGYYDLPPEKQPVDKEGWLHTGDLGYLDAEGYLHLAGRIKEIIVRNGENISPQEIEESLFHCDGVYCAKVLGYRDASRGETVVACVATLPDREKTGLREKIEGQLREFLTTYKLPDEILLFEKLPMTVSGKVDVSALRRQAEKCLGKAGQGEKQS